MALPLPLIVISRFLPSYEPHKDKSTWIHIERRRDYPIDSLPSQPGYYAPQILLPTRDIIHHEGDPIDVLWSPFRWHLMHPDCMKVHATFMSTQPPQTTENLLYSATFPLFTSWSTHYFGLPARFMNTRLVVFSSSLSIYLPSRLTQKPPDEITFPLLSTLFPR